MTTATLYLAGPTRFERALQRLAGGLTAHVERRIADRTARREASLDLLRQRQTQLPDPRLTDHLLAQLGAPRR